MFVKTFLDNAVVLLIHLGMLHFNRCEDTEAFLKLLAKASYFFLLIFYLKPGSDLEAQKDFFYFCDFLSYRF